MMEVFMIFSVTFEAILKSDTRAVVLHFRASFFLLDRDYVSNLPTRGLDSTTEAE